MIMTSIPLSDARKNFSQLISDISKPNSGAFGISVRGHDVAVLISQADYDELMKAKYRDEFREVFNELDEFNKAMVNK